MSEKSFAIVTVASATVWGILFYPPGVPKNRPEQAAQPRATEAVYSRQSEPGPQPMNLSAPATPALKGQPPIPNVIMAKSRATAMLGPVP